MVIFRVIFPENNESVGEIQADLGKNVEFKVIYAKKNESVGKILAI